MAEALQGELLALQQRLRTDTPFWAGGLNNGVPTRWDGACKIVDVSKKLVPLKARPWQARTPDTPAHIRPLDEVIDDRLAQGVPVRIRILKARKLGFSTWVQARFMRDITQNELEYALVVAHLADSYGELANMARRIYDNLPNDHELAELIYGPGSGRSAPFSIKPQLVAEGNTRGSRYMQLGSKQRPSMASTYTTLTAGSKGGGRATTPNKLHLSECAHYDDDEFLLGVRNAVAKEPGSIVIEETTANGFNRFYDEWQAAVEGQEDENAGGIYIPLFYGWQDNPYNAMRFLSDRERDAFEKTIGDVDGGGDDEEILLLEEFGCSLEQLKWRRVTKADECGGKLEEFHQEHPATPEQAFIGSGQPVFDSIRVTKMIRRAEAAPEPVSGVLRATETKTIRTKAGTIDAPVRVAWVPEELISAEEVKIWGDSRLLVWEHPVNERTQVGVPEAEVRPDGQYVGFCDVSTGQGNTLKPGDWHALQMLDHVTRMQVARYRSRIPLEDLPIVVALIGTYYNVAWLAPEVNGPGIALVNDLKAMRYRRMYRRRRAGDDQRTDQREYLLGWETTTRTKPMMEATFGQVLKEEEHGLRDPATGREFTTYVEDAKNPVKHGALKGSHDDLVISFMGAHRVAGELKPRDPGTKAGKVSGPDYDNVHDG